MNDLEPTIGRPPNSLHYAIGEMSGKLDQLVANLNPRLVRLEDCQVELDGKIDALHAWKSKATGATAVIVFIITSLEVIRYVIQL